MLTSAFIERCVIVLAKTLANGVSYRCCRCVELLFYIASVNGKTIGINAAAVIKSLTKHSACLTPLFANNTDDFLNLLNSCDQTFNPRILYHMCLVLLFAKCSFSEAHMQSNTTGNLGSQDTCNGFEIERIKCVLRSLVPLPHVLKVFEEKEFPILFHEAYLIFLVNVYGFKDQVKKVLLDKLMNLNSKGEQLLTQPLTPSFNFSSYL